MNRNLYINQLISEVTRHAHLDTGIAEQLEGVLVVRELQKKEYLLVPGQVAKTMNFIACGCLRSYYVDEQGVEHILQFGIENWWVNDLYSYISEGPSRMYVQALEKTILVQISRQDLDQLFLVSHGMSDFFRIKIQKAYVALQERMIGKMSTDAYTRYISFIENYRNIEQRIPQYMVASYLGITPEFLSYLRNKHAKARS